MGVADFDARLDGQSGCFKVCPEFPLVVVVSNSLALAAVCIQKQYRLLLRQCSAKLFCSADKTCSWFKDDVS